jgi:hypothetical protein
MQHSPAAMCINWMKAGLRAYEWVVLTLRLPIQSTVAFEVI